MIFFNNTRSSLNLMPLFWYVLQKILECNKDFTANFPKSRTLYFSMSFSPLLSSSNLVYNNLSSFSVPHWPEYRSLFELFKVKPLHFCMPFPNNRIVEPLHFSKYVIFENRSFKNKVRLFKIWNKFLVTICKIWDKKIINIDDVVNFFPVK